MQKTSTVLWVYRPTLGGVRVKTFKLLARCDPVGPGFKAVYPKGTEVNVLHGWPFYVHFTGLHQTHKCHFLDDFIQKCQIYSMYCLKKTIS